MPADPAARTAPGDKSNASIALLALVAMLLGTLAVAKPWVDGGVSDEKVQAPPAAGNPDNVPDAREDTNVQSTVDVLESRGDGSGQELPAAGEEIVRPDEVIEKPEAEAAGFEEKFASLADAEDWDGLARLIQDALRSADPLDEFLPVLWACLESVEWRATYQPVGRAVQIGLLQRTDLKEFRESLNEEFLSSESPLVIAAIAGPVVHANSAESNPALKLRIEKLLVHREMLLKGTKSYVVRNSYEGMLIAAHTASSASVLESIEFVLSLRATGLSDFRYVKFWESSVTSALYHRRYSEGDVAAIIRHLLEFSHERLVVESGRAEGLAGLKKIWPVFREDAALAAIEAASASATDQAVRDAWDDIAVAWLAQKK